MERENSLIFIDTGEEIDANNFTVDVYFEDDDRIVAVELKSVKPNAGEMRGEKQKILEAKSALHRKFPNKGILFFIGFPFDPTSKIPTGSKKELFLNSIIDGNKYYEYPEILLADELWNYLSSDENTMQQILDIINSIATPKFQEKYNLLNNTDTNLSTKVKILLDWNILSEIELINSESEILSEISKDKRLRRVYKQTILKNGNYNFNRFLTLKKLIHE